MLANRRRDSAQELALRSALHRRGLRFRVDLPIRAGGLTTRPDIVFTRARVAIYCDGCFWHRCPIHGSEPAANSEYWRPKLAANVERDRRANRALEQAGWRVLRIWEHVPSEDAVELVLEALGER
jgi:DNA mismatch endonuclease (patch repair protein)